MRPGRSCPVAYRYTPADLARTNAWRAETLYVAVDRYAQDRDVLRTMVLVENAKWCTSALQIGQS